MRISEAKEKIEGYLNNYKALLERDGMSVSSSCELLTRDFESCDEDSKKLAFICGEITLKPVGGTDEDSMIYAMIIDAKRGRDIEEETVTSEINDFSVEMSRVLSELHTAPSPEDFIKAEISRASEESDASLLEFEEGLNKFTRNTFILGAIVIAVIASLAALLSHIL